MSTLLHSQVVTTGRIDVFDDHVMYTSYVSGKIRKAENVCGLLWNPNFERLTKKDRAAQLFSAYWYIEDPIYSTVDKLAVNMAVFFGEKPKDPERIMDLSFGTLDGIVYRSGYEIILPNRECLSTLTDLLSAIRILDESLGNTPKAWQCYSHEDLVHCYISLVKFVWDYRGNQAPDHYTLTLEREVCPLERTMQVIQNTPGDAIGDDSRLYVERIHAFMHGVSGGFFDRHFVVYYIRTGKFYIFLRANWKSSCEFGETIDHSALYEALDQLLYSGADVKWNGYDDGEMIAGYYHARLEPVPNFIVVYDPTAGSNFGILQHIDIYFKGLYN